MGMEKTYRVLVLLALCLIAAVGFFIYAIADIRSDRIKDAFLLEDIGMAIFEINTLTSDYLLDPDERTVRQWRSRQEILNGLLSGIQPKDRSDKALFGLILDNNRDLALLFDDLVGDVRKPAEDRDPAYRELLTGQLLARTQSMISAAYQLNRANRSRITSTLMTGGVGIFSVSLLLLLIAAGSVFFRQSLVRALEDFRQRTGAAAAGDLDHRIGHAGPGELRELARDFDRMTESLREYREALDREQTELRRSESLLRSVLELLPVGVWVLDEKGIVLMVNEAAREIWGGIRYVPMEGYGEYKGWFPGSEKPLEAYEWAAARALTRGEVVIEEEVEIEGFDGGRKTIHNSALPLRDSAGKITGAVTVQWDVTRQKEAEGSLQASLAEKDILLRELSHRTKNNMQVIAGLLSLQAASVSDEKLVEAFADAQDRIRAMALVHEKLYQSGNVSSLDMKEYIQNLVASLLRAHRGNHGLVTPVLDVEEMLLSLDTAQPCGLIVNELVSNSLKHAFRERKEGRIFLRLYRRDGKVVLTYRDDGPGLPRELDPSRVRSLGLRLVHSLVVRQLRGTMELRHDSASEFVIRFPEQDLAEKMYRA